MKMLMQCLAVGAAGFLGAVARLLVGQLCSRWFRTGFPIGTLVINVSGSLVLGWFLAVMSRNATAFSHRISPETLRLTVAVGFVGAYTTFSTFMFESNSLLARGAVLQGMTNLLGSLLLGLIALRMGFWLGGH